MKIHRKFLSQKTLLFWLVGLTLSMLLPACSLLQPFQSAPQNVPPGEILFADDFSEPGGT